MALSESFEWVLCCLDVASKVSSLSRRCILRRVPRACVCNFCVHMWVKVSCLSRRCFLCRVTQDRWACVCNFCVYVSKSFEWVLCCLDVTSNVSSLSRRCVLYRVPRDWWVCHIWVKALSRSCAVWMLRPMLAACQDVALRCVLCQVHRAKLWLKALSAVWMLPPMLATSLDIVSYVRYLKIRSVCHIWVKALSGCAVWTLHPMIAACQDVAFYDWYPQFGKCVCSFVCTASMYMYNCVVVSKRYQWLPPNTVRYVLDSTCNYFAPCTCQLCTLIRMSSFLQLCVLVWLPYGCEHTPVMLLFATSLYTTILFQDQNIAFGSGRAA